MHASVQLARQLGVASTGFVAEPTVDWGQVSRFSEKRET